MSVFAKGEPLGQGPPRRFKIKVTTEDGRVFYWHKRGQLHVVDEDVAALFIANFKPALFQVKPDGTLAPPSAGETFPIRTVEMELA